MAVITTPRPLRAVGEWARRVDAAIAAGGAGNAAAAVRAIDELHLTWQRDVAAADARLTSAARPTTVDLGTVEVSAPTLSVDVRG